MPFCDWNKYSPSGANEVRRGTFAWRDFASGRNSLHVSTRAPYLSTTAPNTGPACFMGLQIASLVAASQTRAEPSRLHVSTREASLSKAASLTDPACLIGPLIALPVAASQTRAVPSSLHVSTREPSWLGGPVAGGSQLPEALRTAAVRSTECQVSAAADFRRPIPTGSTQSDAVIHGRRWRAVASEARP